MAETQDYIQTLHGAIRKGHGCEAEHVASVPLEEVFQGKTIWKGIVEVFDLIEHPTAEVAYAWGHAVREAGDEVRLVVVLGVPPVNSPRQAVQASILSDSKKAG